MNDYNEAIRELQQFRENMILWTWFMGAMFWSLVLASAWHILGLRSQIKQLRDRPDRPVTPDQKQVAAVVASAEALQKTLAAKVDTLNGDLRARIRDAMEAQRVIFEESVDRAKTNATKGIYRKIDKFWSRIRSSAKIEDVDTKASGAEGRRITY